MDYLERGHAYLELNAKDKAIADFAAAARLNPENAKANIELGDARMDQHDPAQAVAAYSEAIRICTSDASAYPQWHARLERADAYLELAKKAEAADDLIHAGRLVPRDNPQNLQSIVDSMDALASAYADAGQYADALKWAEKSIELAPDEATKETYRQQVKELKAKQSPRAAEKLSLGPSSE